MSHAMNRHKAVNLTAGENWRKHRPLNEELIEMAKEACRSQQFGACQIDERYAFVDTTKCKVIPNAT